MKERLTNLAEFPIIVALSSNGNLHTQKKVFSNTVIPATYFLHFFVSIAILNLIQTLRLLQTFLSNSYYRNFFVQSKRQSCV